MTDLFQAQTIENPHAENIELDSNVINALPQSSEATSIRASGHGASFWTRTAEVKLTFPGGTQTRYFLKVASGDRGRGMLEGEYESMSVIHDVTPDFAPKPIAWGTFASNLDLHFFISDFHDMDGEVPEQKAFAENLAKLHRESKSPEGKFGFHVTTYNGNIPQDVRWTNTWEECFVNGTKMDFELERAARGPSPELDELMVPLFSKVIPRLLRPLETGDRRIKPCFVHGDLWYGNTSNDAITDLPLVFDAAGFYGHNEFDVKSMRISRYQFGRSYMNAYHQHFPISAPEEDFEARLALYALRSYLHESTLFVSDPNPRKELITETRKLVEMFAHGSSGEADNGVLEDEPEAIAGAPS